MDGGIYGKRGIDQHVSLFFYVFSSSKSYDCYKKQIKNRHFYILC